MAPTRDRLLPDVEVEEAADLALRVGARRLFLEAADEEHLAVELRQMRRRGHCDVVHKRAGG